MITEAAARRAAQDWIEAWNTRDLDRICSHYAQTAELWTHTVVTRWGIPDGRPVGIESIRKHFAKGLEVAPNIRFELVGVLIGMDGYTVVYRRESGALVADVVSVDEDGKAAKVGAYYSRPPAR